MPVSDWTREQDWNVVFLDDKRMPGVARVDIKLAGCLDVKKAKGARNANVVDAGVEPARLDIGLTLLPSDMEEFARFLPVMRAHTSDGAARELLIGHPLARLYGVQRVKINNISTPSPRAGGALLVEITAIEHVEKPKAVKQPAPAHDNPEHWKTDPLTAALRESPSASGAAEENFSSVDQIQGSGF